MATDNSSRTRSKLSYWQNHISCWRHSGLSQAQYCTKKMLALSTFSYWKRKLAQPEKVSPEFYPLTVQDNQTVVDVAADSGLQVVIGKQRFKIQIAKGFSPATLATLVKTLEKL